MSEFGRLLRLDEVGTAPVRRRIEADGAELQAVAARLGLTGLDSLVAELSARRTAAGIEVAGRVDAQAVQACALTGLPVPARVSEAIHVRFVAGVAPAAEELELAEADLDILPLEGGFIELGELAVQTLALALPPFPNAEGPEADAIRALLLSEEDAAAVAEADRRAASPFAALARNS